MASVSAIKRLSRHLIKHSLQIFLSSILALIIGLLAFAQINTRPRSAVTPGFRAGRDLEMAFLGDSLATDMVRAYNFWLDAYRLITPTSKEMVLNQSDEFSEPASLFEWIKTQTPVKITNYSRPGADLYTRNFFNEPPRWQRKIARIPDFDDEVDLFLKNAGETKLAVIWTGHVDMLYWNSYQGARAADRISAADDEKLREWIIEKWIEKFDESFRRLVAWAGTNPNKTLIIFGLLDWKSVVRVSSEIQKLKMAGSTRFTHAEERKDVEGQLKLWNAFNSRLKKLSEQYASQADIRFSSAMNDIPLNLEDFESDGIHPNHNGQKKLAFYMFRGLQSAAPEFFKIR